MVWKKSDQILLCWLLGTLTPGVLGQVTQCKTSLEMWSKIKRAYLQQSMTVTKGSDSISEFVLKIKNICNVTNFP
ncbi:hypothetical protein ACOSP7_021838 [Xanthoceras sorbifolium]